MQYNAEEINLIYDILQSIRKNENFRDCTDFIAEGLLDSFEVFMLIEKIEEYYKIELKGEDIIPENFLNINAIMKIIHKYKAE